MNAEDSAEPIACTLGNADLKARLERIASLARRSLRQQLQDGMVLSLTYSPDAGGELRELVALEQECCAFLQFDLRESPSAAFLTITAPASASAFAAELFGHFVAAEPGCERACTCAK